MTCVSYNDIYTISNRLNTSENQYEKGGTVYVWGNPYAGGAVTVGGLPGKIAGLSNVKYIYSTIDSYAALLEDGSVYVWGSPVQCGSQGFLYLNNSKITNVKTIRTTFGAFAAILNNGDVITWGDVSLGGNPYNFQSSSGYSSPLLIPDINANKIYSTSGAFAMISTNGNVYTWGNTALGGTDDGNFYQIPGLTNIKSITANYSAFAGLLNDGTVYVWGVLNAGGANSISGLTSGVISDLNNVKAIYSTVSAFSALKNDGSVFIWGNPLSGGSIDGVNSYINLSVSNVTNIYNTGSAFAAQIDNQVYIWGHPASGGNINYSAVYSPSYILDIKNVCATNQAFAGLTTSNQIYVWGSPGDGGSNVYNNPAEKGIVSLSSNIKFITSSNRAFAAISSNGLVIRWGNSSYGGGTTGNPEVVIDISDAEYIYYNLFVLISRDINSNFHALGNTDFGGDNTQVSGIQNFTTMYNNWKTFAALQDASEPIDIVNPPDPPTPSTSEPDDVASNISPSLAGFVGLILGFFIFISFYFISKAESSNTRYILFLLSFLISAGVIVLVSLL
jgi:alpha-tubulin suppressor-like RCC1 family protein